MYIYEAHLIRPMIHQAFKHLVQLKSTIKHQLNPF